jgi:signal transduction histidine kinase
MRSLRRQLLRTLTLTLLAVFITQGFVLYGALVHLANSQTLLHLSHDSESVLSAIDVDGKGQLTLDEQRVESVYRHPGSGQYFLVLIQGGGRLASGSLGTHGLEARVPGPGQSLDYEARGPDGHPLKVLARSSVVQGRPVTLLVAEDMSLARQEIWETGLLSLAVFAPLLALALLLQGLAVSRALAPLRRVRDELAEVGAGHLARIQGPVPREVRPLVDEVNRLLVLLEQRVRQSRTAVGNLAHALKTPLAVLLQAGEAPGVPETLREAVRAQAGAIHERIDRELRRARLAGPGGHGAGAHFNPGAELPALVRMLKSVHHEKALGIEVQAPDRRLPFDREDMLELLGNLADNACKWARQRVRIELSERPVRGERPVLAIRVGDDGPGCSDDALAKLPARGVRLDESRSGHGLGLTIVRDIAELLGGTLAFGRSQELGGLEVRVDLPFPGDASRHGPG